MGWPKKNEEVRMYRLGKDRYALYFQASEEYHEHELLRHTKVGTFCGPVRYVAPYDPTKWSIVRRSSLGLTVIRIDYDGHKQHSMDNYDTLCLPGKHVNATEATDQEIIEAFTGDEDIYTGTRAYPQNSGVLVEMIGSTPQTYGGTAKRISWDQLPEPWQQRFVKFLHRKPEQYRGLWRVSNA